MILFNIILSGVYKILVLFQKKLDASVFKIGSTQAAKKKWVAMGKQVSRKVLNCELAWFLLC